MASTHSSPTFSLAQARQLVADLFRVRPWIYWGDFALTYGIAVFCFQRVRGGPLWVPHQGLTGEPMQVIYFFLSCLMFYRAAMFIHELVHQQGQQLRRFTFIWNLLCGIPFLMPTFIYFTHLDHHRRKHYGTDHDGEYIPLSHRSPWFIFVYLSWSLIIPLLAVFRFLILSPLAWCFPRLRRMVHQRWSSMVMDPNYIRPLPTAAVMRTITLQEIGCFAWCIGIAVGPKLLLGRWPIEFLIQAYLMSIVIVTLNAIRTLGAHRWTNHGHEMTFLQQLLDSVNYPHRPWLTELWAPVGTRYHALHHLFPSLPYHALNTAHRRLMQHLPADSPYRLTEERSLWQALSSLWHRAQESQPEARISSMSPS